MVATIKFKTDRGTDWYVTKEFTDKKHMNNFIKLRVISWMKSSCRIQQEKLKAYALICIGFFCSVLKYVLSTEKELSTIAGSLIYCKN